MDARAYERLQAFAQTTPDKCYVSADDVERFCALCIELHRAKLAVTGFEIREELQRYGFDSYTALKLGLQFERYRQLLEQSDYSRSS
jgi:hypothetical protein